MVLLLTEKLMKIHMNGYFQIIGMKKMIICLDGLSLERHRSFVNKLCKVPMRFADSYKQSLIFQKSLSRVIEVSGPLHASFHMLQVTCDIYKSLLQATQKCLGRKKINMSQVSETHRPCHSIVSILYEKLV